MYVCMYVCTVFVTFLVAKMDRSERRKDIHCTSMAVFLVSMSQVRDCQVSEHVNFDASKAISNDGEGTKMALSRAHTACVN